MLQTLYGQTQIPPVNHHIVLQMCAIGTSANKAQASCSQCRLDFHDSSMVGTVLNVQWQETVGIKVAKTKIAMWQGITAGTSDAQPT